LLTDESETFVLNKPYKSEKRYAPLPLIQDSTILANSGRDEVKSNSFFSVYEAVSTDHTNSQIENINLFYDVKKAIRRHGSTRLSAVLYVTPTKQGVQIRVRRRTYFDWDGHNDYSQQDYNMSLETFLSARAAERWYHDILHLLAVKTDRAARHIRERLERLTDPEMEKPEVVEKYDKFMASFGKGKRRPNYEAYLDHVLTNAKSRSSMFFKAKVCIMCNKPLQGPRHKHNAVALPCNGKHLVGRSCISRCFDGQDPAEVQCPHCGKAIFTSPVLLDKLKFNITDGIFHNDPRFTRWENFERACSDLDLRAASRSEYPITIHPHFLIKLWHTLVTEGTDGRTLPHLQPTRAPEFKILAEVVGFNLLHLEGVHTNLHTLDRWLRVKVFGEFRRRYLAAGLDRGLTSAKRVWMSEGDLMREMFRSGFAGFVSQLLNRTLQFLECRACYCSDGLGKEVHWHGQRFYYNPKVIAALAMELTPDSQKVILWQRSVRGQAYLAEFHAEGKKKDGLVGKLYK
jgi:hypothetical protein